MAYNTRRSGEGLSNIGQRRNPTNFVSGGQLTPQNNAGGGGGATGLAQTQQKVMQKPQQQKAVGQPAARPNPQNQLKRQPQPQQQQQNASRPFQQMQPKIVVQKTQPMQQQQTAAQQANIFQPKSQNQAVTVSQEKQVNVDAKQIIPGIDDGSNDVSMEGVEEKTKKKWMKGGKISKKEKQRRRNIRLSKILQPKNAVMILNELIKNPVFVVSDVNPMDNQFKASVTVDGVDHIGFGKSKVEAKNAASEAALRRMIKTKHISEIKKEGEEEEERMEVADDDASAPLPWQHVASFALYKLLNSWGEDENQMKAYFQGFHPTAQNNLGGGAADLAAGTPVQGATNRPAKKLPENPDQMNPIMLLNQMRPNAQFEEIGRSGVSPNIMFTFKCTTDDKSFTGAGTSKKNARKAAAYMACHHILGIEYPPEIWAASGEFIANL